MWWCKAFHPVDSEGHRLCTVPFAAVSASVSITLKLKCLAWLQIPDSSAAESGLSNLPSEAYSVLPSVDRRLTWNSVQQSEEGKNHGTLTPTQTPNATWSSASLAGPDVRQLSGHRNKILMSDRVGGKKDYVGCAILWFKTASKKTMLALIESALPILMGPIKWRVQK